MADSRAAVVWGQVAAHAAAQDRSASVVDVCAVAASSTGVSGAWVTASSGQDPDFVLCVTGPVSEQLAELQLTLGEGPCHDVLAAAAPVLAVGLGDAESGRRWPVFAPEAHRLGAPAIFAFPLMVGAIRAGVMGLYRSTPGPLNSAHFGDALILADAAAMLLLDSAAGGSAINGAGLDGQAPELILRRAEIDQATGMLTVQLGVPIAEAFARLRAYAYTSDRRLAEVAADIVARRLRLPRDPPPDSGP